MKRNMSVYHKKIFSTYSKNHQNYLLHQRKTKRWILFIQCFFFFLLLLLWELLSRYGIINSFLFSSPSGIAKTLQELILDKSIFYHIGITILETLLSFFLVNFIGLLVAVLLWWNKTIARILDPYLVVLNSLPKSALAPLFIVWLGNNMKTILVAAVSVALFGTILTLYHQYCETEPDKIKLIQTLGGTKKDVLLKVVIPSAFPAFLSLMKVNIGLSLVGVIIGEFLAAKSGLGYLIIYGGQVFKLDLVLLSIGILCLLATILYIILARLEQKYT